MVIVKKLSKYTIIFIINFLISYSCLNAKSGTTGMNFLKIEVGAKASGSGGAFCAVSDDASAVYWNPAGLVEQRFKQLSLMHTIWFENIKYQFLSYTQPISTYSTIAASVYYLSMDDIKSYDATGSLLDITIEASNLAAGISYAGKINRFDYGATVKFLNGKLADESSITYAFDFGLLYRLGTQTRFAIVVKNLGQGIKYIKEEDSLPQSYHLGFSRDLFKQTLTVSCDAVYYIDSDIQINSGIDYRISDVISLRTGYRFKTTNIKYDIQPSITAGIGIGNDYISLDYAFVPYGDLGATHRIGLNYRFGKPYEEYLFKTKAQKHLRLGKRYLMEKDYIKAYSEINRILMLDPINSEAISYMKQIKAKIDDVALNKYIQKVELCFKNNNFIEAKEILETIVKIYPDNTNINNYLIRVNKVFEDQKASRIDTLYSQGLEFYNQKRYSDAISIWEKVLLVEPEHQKAKESIIIAQDEIRKIEEEKKKKEQEAFKKRINEIYHKGLSFYKNKQWEKAKSCFEEALKLTTDKDIENHLHEVNQQLAEKYYNSGLEYYNKKNINQAINLWKQAIDLQPDNQKANEMLSKVLKEQKEINQQKAEEFNLLGLKAYDSGNLKVAIENWEKALSLDPENIKIKNNLNRAKDELKSK